MLTLTARTCGHCGGYLWAAWVDGAGAALFGCPTCDRPRCSNCAQPFGLLFAPHVPRWTLTDVAAGQCEPCLMAPTEHEQRQAA